MASFVIWGAVAASAMYWGLRLLARPAVTPAHAAMAAPAPPRPADLTVLFGAPVTAAAPLAVAAPVADSRFRLLGVMAPKSSSTTQGLALISIDGKPARAFAAGASVEDQLTVISVGHRKVELGPRGGQALVVMELPIQPPAARGAPGAVLSMARPARFGPGQVGVAPASPPGNQEPPNSDPQAPPR